MHLCCIGLPVYTIAHHFIQIYLNKQQYYIISYKHQSKVNACLV